MDRQILTFRELIAPIEPEEFFGETYRKKALHIPGPADKFAKIFSWTDLNDLISMSTIWTDKSFEMALDGRSLPPREYCTPGREREGGSAGRPDPRRVREFLSRGATLALDYIGLLTPGLRSLTQTLETVTGAPVTVSSFASWRQTPGYASHFDTQNVFACHLSGTKVWRIYEGRMRDAAEVPGGKSPDYDRSHHEKAKGAVREEVAMTPGDLLYIPHGQYHDALSTSESCLHVSFGACHPIVQDFVDLLGRELYKIPEFREHLPHFDDRAGLEARLRAVADRLREIILEPQILGQLGDYLRQRTFERRAEFDLPSRQPGSRFRVRWLGKRLARRGPGWRLEAMNTGTQAKTDLGELEAEVAKWAIARDFFSMEHLAEAFAEHAPDKLSPEKLSEVLEKLRRAGLIEAI